jgi:DNA polymerase-3 subunit gamma/tau
LQGQKKLKDSEVQIRNTTQPRLWLEITLLNLLPSANLSSIVTTTQVNSSGNTSIQVINTPSEKISTNTKVIANYTQKENGEKSIQQIDLSDFSEVKEKVAQAIEKVTTKSFIKQSCQIVSIEGQMVKIAVGSRFLLEIGNQQKKDIELGFSKVFGKKMSVLLVENKDIKSEKIEPQKQEERKTSTPIKSVDNYTSKTNNSSPSKPKETVISHRRNGEANSLNAATILAKSVNGEIVSIEPKSTDIKLINRPEIPNVDDEDDLPF